MVDAFREATDLINTNRRKAAEIYVADTGGKESVEETEKQLADPEFIFDLGPKKLIKLTDFMNASGTIKAQADLLEGDVLPGGARPLGRLRSDVRSAAIAAHVQEDVVSSHDRTPTGSRLPGDHGSVTEL